ncbi:hypothetical protein ABIF50_002542 [Bradyrhizobium diazoefficiens]
MPDQQRRDCGDQGDVEQQRRERRERKTPLRVEQPHQHGDGAGESEIGQHQPRVLDGEIEAAATEKSRRDHRDDQRHQQRNDDRDRDQGRADRAEHASRERGGGRLAVAIPDTQPGRDQRRVQGPFAEQPPHHVDELEGRQKGIRHRAGAEQGGNHGIARKAQQSRGQCSRRGGQEGADHCVCIIPWLAREGRVVIGREPDFRQTGSGFSRQSQSAKQDQGEWLT